MAEPQKTTTLVHGRNAPSLVPARIRVVEGPDRGAEVILREGTAVIGTRADCQLVLSDSAVSRRHASIELLAGLLRVRDLGSKNGTWHLGTRIESADVPLGALIGIGSSKLASMAELGTHEPLSDRTGLEGLVGRSVAMRRLFALLERAAATEVPVLLTGETGSGKEAAARAMHALSRRGGKPFVVFDCAAHPGELVQSALFGHVRGAFTGAVQDVRGALERAQGGTLLLDNVSELPGSLQPALLRVLDTRLIQPLGSTESRRSDFRLVTASRVALDPADGRSPIRPELYYRLAAVELRVPPLRERPEDVAPLAEHFAQQLGEAPELPSETLALLASQPWPGNVRELRNAVERLLRLGSTEQERAADEPGYYASRDRAVKAFEKSYLEALLRKHAGSATAAAREARIARSYFYRLLEEHQLKPR